MTGIRKVGGSSPGAALIRSTQLLALNPTLLQGEIVPCLVASTVNCFGLKHQLIINKLLMLNSAPRYLIRNCISTWPFSFPGKVMSDRRRLVLASLRETVSCALISLRTATGAHSSLAEWGRLIGGNKNLRAQQPTQTGRHGGRSVNNRAQITTCNCSGARAEIDMG